MNFAQAHGDHHDPDRHDTPAGVHPPPKKAPDRRKVALAYVGRRSSLDNPADVFHAYVDAVVDPEASEVEGASLPPEGKARLYKKRIGPTYTPGVVIEVDADPETHESKAAGSLTVYTASAKVISRVDSATAARWATLDRATFTAAEAAKERKKVAEFDPLDEFIDPIRRAYQNAAPSKRHAILANVIASIMKGGRS